MKRLTFQKEETCNLTTSRWQLIADHNERPKPVHNDSSVRCRRIEIIEK